MTQLAYSRTSKQRNQHVRNFLSLLRTLYSSSCTCISLSFFLIETYLMCHFLFCKWKFIVFLFGYVFISCAFVMFSSTDLWLCIFNWNPLILFLLSPPRVAFRLLGLCNNFAYVVMLSAAYDILQKQESTNATASVTCTTFSPPPLHIGLNEARAVLID